MNAIKSVVLTLPLPGVTKKGISPYNFNAFTGRKVIRSEKNISLRMFLESIPNSQT